MNVLIDTTLILHGKTRHAMNRIREHGNSAIVTQLMAGRICVETPDGDWRWISLKNDSHFSFSVVT